MDAQTPSPTPTPAGRKGLSPLAIVLLLSTGFFFLFMVAVGAMFFWKSDDHWDDASSKKASSSLFSGTKGAVGVIEVEGVIMDSKKLVKEIKEFKEESSIKALVLRLNTPGGAVAPSQEIYQAVKGFGKPVVASMGSIAASGGYYIAVAAQKIFANPGTLTGSIGVIMEFANLKKLYEWARIDRYAITSGKFKAAGAEYREMTQEERQLFKDLIDDTVGQFKGAVAEGRHMKMEKLNPLADGRVYTGQQAKAVGLVDTMGTLEDAIAEAAKMAKIKGEPRVVYPHKHQKSLVDLLVQNSPDDDAQDSRSPVSDALLA
ncbi:MAG TPA: signal peptide peptidase SppA, partial [Bdellovibrionota bacterium]|nr:signal peptide peptidase SppA [Bdellovibrionota bacterium]